MRRRTPSRPVRTRIVVAGLTLPVQALAAGFEAVERMKGQGVAAPSLS